MRKKRYIVEIAQELVTPITVYANSENEAGTLVIDEQGEPGDSYFLGHKIISVTLKSNDDPEAN